jgi:hypothetical protein
MGNEKMGNKKMSNQKTGNEKTGRKKTGSKNTGANKPRSHHSATGRPAKQILPFHRRRCIIIKDPKHRGEWTELVFMTRVAERGFNVSKPWGDSSRYDCAVELRGHFLRVQVKSTIARQFNGYIVTIKSGYHYYTRHQVDFFAVYVIPEDVWYILPAKIITILRSNFLLAPRRHPQKYEAYKEAWHLLKVGCHAASRLPAAPAAKACPERVEGRRKIAAHRLP